MVGLPDAENILKIYLFVFAESTNVTDRRTLRDGIGRAYASAKKRRTGSDCVVQVVANEAGGVYSMSTLFPLLGTLNRTETDHYTAIRRLYTGRLWASCCIWYSEEEPGRTAAPPSPLLAVPKVTVHPSTASVPASYYSTWHCNYTFAV